MFHIAFLILLRCSGIVDDVSNFLKSLKAELVHRNGTLSIKCSASTFKYLGLKGDSKEVLFLFQRKEHERVWSEINAGRKKTFGSQAVVVGTAGVGKSAFRFYLIRMWMHRAENFDFDSVVFNIEDDFYLIDRDGNASEILCSQFSRKCNSRTLGLLDPCASINGRRRFVFGLTVITTSPSPLAGFDPKCSLTQLQKESITYVMGMFTEQEARSIVTDWESYHEIFEKFSIAIGGTTYCSVRWLFYDKEDLEGQLNKSRSVCHQDGLCRWILSCKDGCCIDASIPYRLCRIVATQSKNGWTISGFISNYVGNLVLKWAELGSRLKRTNFVNLIQNPLTGGIAGTWYENWVFDTLQAGRPLDIAGRLLYWRNLQSFEGSERNVKTEEGTLYRPSTTKLPSIDGYGVVENMLVMLKITVSPYHSAALWTHVQHIVQAARARDKKRAVTLVYVVPFVNKFTVPACSTLDGHNITVCVGTVPEDFFPCVQKMLRGTDGDREGGDTGRGVGHGWGGGRGAGGVSGQSGRGSN